MRQKRLYLIMSGMQIGDEIWHVWGSFLAVTSLKQLRWSDKSNTAL